MATIGPASETEEILTNMIKVGMNIARFNTKHSDPVWHADRIARVRKVASELNQPIGVLLDLQGPEVRIDVPENGEFAVAKDKVVILTSDRNFNDGKTAWVPETVVSSLNEGDEILIADGSCELSIVGKEGNRLIAKALFDCVIKHRKTLNTPGIILDLPSLTERDIQYLDGVDLQMVDFVGLSFVRGQADIAHLRGELDKRNSKAAIIAKIENQAALDNLEEIIAVADGVMVARGDLGVEVPFQELIFWQKKIIELSRRASKPVITATEMLKSMVTNPRPTRAEVSDVAHAIYDGTDAIMLSDETTIGKYPVKVVQTQALIAMFNEPHVKEEPFETFNLSPTASICYSAMQLTREKQPATRIMCLTETGNTATILASFHPTLPIYALTSNEASYRRMSLLHGVTPILTDWETGTPITTELLIEKAKALNVANSGEYVLAIHGSVWQQSGRTDNMSLISIN